MSATYDSDFYAWANEQAALLRAGKLNEADIAHIAEEIESMGKTEKRELVSRLAVLLVHLLKWKFQPAQQGRSWRLTIKAQRKELRIHLADNPSLRALSNTALTQAYDVARVKAARETPIDEDEFPDVCPWSFEQAIDDAFWPGVTRRIHITGASGSGTTTLGRALAGALGSPCHDGDDYLWRPSDPPYREWRPLEERLQLMQDMFRPLPDWVLSGSVMGWGNIERDFDLVIFLRARPKVRLERLRARETAHFGAQSVAPGGWRHGETEQFLDWAAHYEDGSREGRLLAKHLAWLEGLSCAVLRLDGERPISELVEAAVAAAPTP